VSHFHLGRTRHLFTSPYVHRQLQRRPKKNFLSPIPDCFDASKNHVLEQDEQQDVLVQTVLNGFLQHSTIVLFIAEAAAQFDKRRRKLDQTSMRNGMTIA
jgi:hypothetical protein